MMILSMGLATALYLAGLAGGLILALTGSLILTRQSLGPTGSRTFLGTSLILTALLVLILGLIAASLHGPAWWDSRYGSMSAPCAGACILLLFAAIHRYGGEQSVSDRFLELILAWLAVGTGAWSLAAASFGA